jgi:hypothetical protein
MDYSQGVLYKECTICIAPLATALQLGQSCTPACLVIHDVQKYTLCTLCHRLMRHNTVPQLHCARHALCHKHTLCDRQIHTAPWLHAQPAVPQCDARKPVKQQAGQDKISLSGRQSCRQPVHRTHVTPGPSRMNHCSTTSLPAQQAAIVGTAQSGLDTPQLPHKESPPQHHAPSLASRLAC